MNCFPRYKLCLFYLLSNTHRVDIENLQGICFPVIAADDFSGLLARTVDIELFPSFVNENVSGLFSHTIYTGFLPIIVVKNFSELFAYLSIFLNQRFKISLN